MGVWAAVAGYDGFYEVSKRGRVRSVDRVVLRGKVRQPVKGRILKPGKNAKTGYLHVCLCRRGKMKFHYVHRLVAEAFIPNPDDLPEVNHKDLDKSNNAASNLEWKTHSGNKIHASENGVVFGRPMRGEEAGNAKLTWRKVRSIRRKYTTGRYSQKTLAAGYGVSQPTIGHIVRQETWIEQSTGLTLPSVK